jgi:hypothetical protein
MENKTQLEILQWKDVKKKVQAVNPRVAKDMNSIKGVDNFKVVRATYQFGDDIIDKGQFKLNVNGKNVVHDNRLVPNEIQEILDYNWRAIPFGIVTKGSTESYIDHLTNILPFRLMPPGTTFSVVSVFDTQQFSNTVAELRSTKAGCRSLIMLPKISHAESNQRLQAKYQVKKENLCPKNLADQWYLLRDLAISKCFETNWEAELILFSKEFISQKPDTLELRYDLLHRVWQMESFRRNQVTHDFIWSMFLKHLPSPLKNDAYIIETVKHLVLIAMQEVPGYIPACDDTAGPITDFTQAFLKCYRIRYHYPIFMRLEHYDGINPIYYSLHRHTFFSDVPEKPSMKQTINQLVKIREVLFLFIEYILKNKFEHPLDKTLLYQTLLNTEFDFFHPKGSGIINHKIKSIARDDKRFLLLGSGINKGLEFPEYSIFFHGCIRIRPKF